MRQVWAALAGLALTCSLLLSVLRDLVVSERFLAIASSLASYAVLGYAFALVVLVVLAVRGPRSRPLLAGLVVAVAGLVVHAVWLAPLLGAGGAGTRTDLVVMNSNLEFGEGDATTIVRTVRSRDVSVLVLEEVTPDEVVALDDAGLDGLLPRHAGAPDPDSAGTMVFSRFALGDVERLAVSNGAIAVTVGAPRPFRLLAVHPSQPLLAARTWVDDLRVVRDQTRAALREGPTMVVGDFNATLDNRLLRDVTHEGVRDAAEQSGAGWQPTWPSMQVVPVPRLLSLDHVLVSAPFSATSTSTVLVPGSDHRALVARLELDWPNGPHRGPGAAGAAGAAAE